MQELKLVIKVWKPITITKTNKIDCSLYFVIFTALTTGVKMMTMNCRLLHDYWNYYLRCIHLITYFSFIFISFLLFLAAHIVYKGHVVEKKLLSSRDIKFITMIYRFNFVLRVTVFYKNKRSFNTFKQFLSYWRVVKNWFFLFTKTKVR